MREYLQFYINGEWVDPVEARTGDVIDPSTEEVTARISYGSKADVDKAVAAAKAAFETFAQTSVEYRADLLDKIVAAYMERMGEIAEVISEQMGAPKWWANAAQAPAGLGHYMEAAKFLREYKFEEMKGGTMIRKEPIGVCGFITPWNWPANQVACKVAPAIAAGCTMVLKPSEIAPMDAMIVAEVMDKAGVPKGVFNLVNGDGPGVGQAMSAHPDIDMMSFTGSTRAGILVAKSAADTVKRVTQELGGKSPNIVLEDADIEKAVGAGVAQMFTNTGQSCNAPSRMFVPRAKQDEAIAVAKAVAEATIVVDPKSDDKGIGPQSNANQWSKTQSLIEAGIKEGATLVAGGPGRPEGFNKGYYTRPTVFANVTNDMTIAKEEIFGPVLCMLPYDSEEEAIAQANDTEYGLAGYVQSSSIEHAQDVAKQIRAGNIHINGVGPGMDIPFGGYKQSGNGREWGEIGMEEFLEIKAVSGYAVAAE